MSKLKHTKGPWTVQEEWGDHYVVTEMGDYIAVASEIYPECSVSIDEDDARLIAAAPEMLEALIYFVRRVREGSIRSKTTYSKYVYIIEKATGMTIEEVLKDE